MGIGAAGWGLFMASFSASDAALSGFRLAGRKPMLILAWAGISLVFAIIYFAVAAMAMIPMMGVIANPDAANSPEAIAAASSGSVLVNLVTLPLSLLMSSMSQAAAYRAILRPEDRGLAYFKLGGDELRILVVNLVLTVLFGIAAVAVFLVMGIVGGGMMFATGGGGEGGGTGAVGGLVIFLLVLAAIIGSIFFAVRFSLAAVITFATRKISIFETWSMTAGRFWPLLGTWVLVVIFAILLYVVLVIVGFVLLMLTGMSGFLAMGGGATPDPAALAGMIGPLLIGGLLFGLLIAVWYALMIAVAMCPAADIYRQLNPAADVFD